METEDMQNLGKHNHEEDSEEVHHGAIKRNREEDSKVVHYDPEDYLLVRVYEGKNSSSNGYPYFFLWQGNLVDAYDETAIAPEGVKYVSKYNSWPARDPLMEVFQMGINSRCISQGDYELYSGKIKIDFGGDLVEIYCKGKTQEKYISDGALLLPTDAAIDALSTISIFVDLKIKYISEHKIIEYASPIATINIIVTRRRWTGSPKGLTRIIILFICKNNIKG